MFNYNGKFMSTLLSLTDAVVLGILWLVCCVPVITIGAASTAFYYAYNKAVCQKMGYAWREFFYGFKSNFKQATKLWLILLALGAVLLADGYLLLVYGEVLPAAGVFMGITLVLTVALVMCGCVLFPYIARFEVGTKEALKNAAIIMLANLFLGILLVILYGAAIVLSLRIPFVGILAPTVYMYFANRILEHVFRKYMTQENLKRETEIQQLDEHGNR